MQYCTSSTTHTPCYQCQSLGTFAANEADSTRYWDLPANPTFDLPDTVSRATSPVLASPENNLSNGNQRYQLRTRAAYEQQEQHRLRLIEQRDGCMICTLPGRPGLSSTSIHTGGLYVFSAGLNAHRHTFTKVKNEAIERGK